MNAPHFKLFSKGSSYIPLGLLSIAAVLRDNNFNVAVYNPDFNKNFIRRSAHGVGHPPGSLQKYEKNLFDDKYFLWKEIERTITKINPEILGISFSTFDYDAAVKVAKICKSINKDIVVVIGGRHVTILPHETMKEDVFDVGAIGEGEYTMNELVRSILHNKKMHKVRGAIFKKSGRIYKTKPRPLIEDLNELPFPARDLLIDEKKYHPHTMGNMITSRGCPYNCNFCTTPKIYHHKIRFRNAKKVIDEIENVNSKYSTLFFTFQDDNFTFDKKRIFELCALIEQRNLGIMWTCITRVDMLNRELLRRMKLSGCYSISLGLESGSQYILDTIPKQISTDTIKKTVKIMKDIGINLHAFFTIGHVDETEESLKKTERLIKEINPDTMNIARVVPFPGTEIFYDLIKNNRLLFKDWRNYSIKLKFLSDNIFEKYDRRLKNIVYRQNLRGLLKTVTKKEFVNRFLKENINSPQKLFFYSAGLVELVIENILAE
jgi:radical SAM superfamily enzyme YgiQ (UPF0313 family)